MAGEPTTAPAIAASRSPLVEANARQLIAPEAVHDRLVADAGVHAHAEPIPELDFDQTMGW